MAKEVTDVTKQAADTVQKPIHIWRRAIIAAGAIVVKPWRRYRAAVFQGYLIGAIGVFVILALLAKTVAYFTFDVTITHAIQNVNVGWFSALMYDLTWLGFAPQAWIISILVLLLLLVSGLKWEAVVSLLSLVSGSALGYVIKLLIVRPRPNADLIKVVAQLQDSSFPSGHVLYFMTFYGFLLFLAYTLLKPSKGRTLLLMGLGALVALIGLSRIYEGEHWASDVIAAYLLGSIWLSLSIMIYRWGKPRFFVNQPVAKENTPD